MPTKATLSRFSWTLIACLLWTGTLSAYPLHDSRIIQRDRWYEENLRQEASADKTLTPAKAFRWLMSLTGHPLKKAPSATEFKPIVNINDSNVRLIAAISYKF